MTEPILRPAGKRPPRIVAGLVAAATLLHMTSASATPGAFPGAAAAAMPAAAPADAFAAQFAPYETPAEPAIPAAAVDLETLATAAEPALDDAAIERLLGSGVASYYGAELTGRRTASGERFDPRALTAAHRTLPFGSKVRVTNPANGRSVIVRINDRGPFTRGRMIDLSRSAAERIGLVARGHGTVDLALLD